MKILKEITNQNRRLVCCYIVIGIMVAFLSNYSANYFQQLIDNFTNETLKIYPILIYGGVLTSLCILNYLDNYPGRKLEHGIYLDLKLKAFEKISRIDYQVYQTLGTGKLVQRIENGAAAGKSILFDYYFCLIRELVPSILFSLFFIYHISKSIMYSILCGYVFVFLITNLLLKALYHIKESILTNEELMNHLLIRGFTEMVVFRMNKRFPAERKRIINAKKEIVDSKVKMTLIHEAFFTIFALLVIVIKLGIIGYGWATKSITIGGVIALINLVDHAFTPIAIFNVLYVQYKLDKTALKRYTTFLDADEDAQLQMGTSIKEINGSITFQDVSFCYGNRTLLKHFNLKLQQGEKVALVGESGSGKSTMIKLITGLLKPKSGSIWIDDKNLSECNLTTYYDQISYISQESPIFDGTLRENLTFGKEIPDHDLIDVLNKVNLTDLYKKLKNGLDTELGEKGITLSGGERQRLAIARLWFDDSKIIILDEATSAMDNLTEEAIMDAFMSLLKDKTVIVIAHRLNSIRNFERIIAFQDGKIVGQGSFDTMIQTNDYFKALYQANVE